MRILKSFKQTFNGKSKAWIQLSFGPALWVKRRFNQRGFSLVELMVVVAIIGILASIAIPNYQKFRRKAQQSGAKSALSGIFTAERTFTAEWNFGATDFDQIGYDQEGSDLYNVGWHSSDATSGDWNASNSSAGNIDLYKGPAAPSSVTHKTGGELGGPIPLNHGGLKGCKCGDGSSNKCGDAGVGCKAPTLSNANPPVATCGNTARKSSGHDNTCTVSGLIVPGNGTTRISVDTFVIGAAANIGGTVDDLWTIDQSKNLVNTQSGL